MKITPKILSIPPYISTFWENILTLQAQEGILLITLKSGAVIKIPNLSAEAISQIFTAHAGLSETPFLPRKESFSFSLPFKADGDLIEAFGPGTQHNPEQASLPPLPPSVLKKIAALATSFGMETINNLPKSEPGCNCIYCQVMNAIHVGDLIEEEVSEEDLRFLNWEVKQTGDQLYIVTNPIDLNEHYSVYLGEPIGCTCGIKNCEHIRAVLNT